MSTGTGQAQSERQISTEPWSQLDETILAMILARTPLPKILELLCLEIEKQHDGLLCSVLLLDSDGATLRTGAAPSLPPEYCRVIDGVKIGPKAGSCGTAAYRKEQVVVSDTATDPLWADYHGLAKEHGLRACWSRPIIFHDGAILGTFAIYYREQRVPDEQHLRIISHATHLAGMAIGHDRAQERLRVVEDRYRTLVERLPAITYIAELGADGTWHYVSPQIETILGYSPKEWLSDAGNWMKRIHIDDRGIALVAEKRFQETHELFHAEYRMFARDGRILWFRDEAVMLERTEDQPLRMQGVLYDITARKRLEDDLRHSQKMEAVGQLAGGVAHDFNNLLMLIQAHNERLRHRIEPSDPAHQDALEIERAVVRASALTRQLLAFGRKQVLHVKVLDLNAVVREVVKMLRQLIGNNIQLETLHATELGRVKADPGQIEQVIVNLAVNARDAMPQGGRLSLETRNINVDHDYAQSRDDMLLGKYVMLAVTDTGMGMDAATRARIFEPFFTTKEAGRGTGLGLATVYGVVAQMNGAVWVRSAPGEGTTFEIYLPQVDDAAEPQALPASSLPMIAAPSGTETILLVEDQDGIRDLVREFLRRKGYTVLLAVDGLDALRIAAQAEQKIDLLLTDVIMPNIGGRELAQRLQPTRPEMKVLFMSGYAEPAPGGEARDHAQVLHKPFLLDALAHKIRRVLGGA